MSRARVDLAALLAWRPGQDRWPKAATLGAATAATSRSRWRRGCPRAA